MHKSLYIIFYLIILITIFPSCEKGDKINTFTPFTNLVLENFENGYKLEIDGNIYSTSQVKIPTTGRESSFVLFNKEGEAEFEGNFAIKPDRDTLVVFKISDDIPVTVMRKESLNEPREEGKLKFRIVNSSNIIETLTDGKPFHLVFYQVVAKITGPPVRRNIVYHEQGDTVFNITRQLPDNYQSIDITDNLASPFRFEGRAQILKEDYSPVLKGGVEAYVDYGTLTIDINKSVYILYLKEDEGSLYSFFPNIQPYWQFSNTLMSAFSY